MQEYTCNKCLKLLPETMFFKDRAQSRGYSYSCKPCINITKLPSKRRSWDKHKDRYNKEKREYFAKNPDVMTNLNMKRYGIDLNEYNRMFKEQHGKCAICGDLPPQGKRKKRFEIDHCHKTGVVRGLLCNRCNLNLGRWDEIKLLNKVIEYLKPYATL